MKRTTRSVPLVWLCAAVLAVIVVVTVTWLVLSRRTEPSTESITFSSGSPEPPAAVARFDEARASAINADITSHDRERLSRAVALPAQASIPDPALAALAASAPWDFDMSTVRYFGTTAAVVTAHSHRDRSTAWQVYLVLDHSDWKISATERQPS